MCQRYRSNGRDKIFALVHWGESQTHKYICYICDKFYKEKNKTL